MPGHPILDPAEHDAWDAFIAMRRQLDRVLEARMRSDGDLSAAEFQVLSALTSAEDRSLRIGEVAAELGWERSRVSHLARRMEARGLAERVDCDDDARGTWLVATAEGRRALLRTVRGHTELLREVVFEPLGPAGLAQLEAVSRRISDAVAESAARP